MIKHHILLLLFFIALHGEMEEVRPEKIIVACVGDSITFGAGLEHPDMDSYPAQLQTLLGSGYLVTNLGIGGCTLIRKGLPTVWNQIATIKASEPDIVIVSLGTNDTCGMGTCGNRKCWEYWDEYEKDYIDLIDTLQSLPSHPMIYICAPSPMVLETPGLSVERMEGLTTRKPRLQTLIDVIRRVALAKEVNFIDLNTPLDHRPELFKEEDGVHLTKDGYGAIAEIVFQQVKSNKIK